MTELAAQLREAHPGDAPAIAAIYAQHVLQADAGCDFDILVRPGATAEPEIY